MENITPELVLMVGIIMALIKIIEKGLGFAYNYLTKNGKGKVDTKQEIRLAVIEQRLKTIEENHLPHIEKRLDSIEAKIDKILLK